MHSSISSLINEHNHHIKAEQIEAISQMLINELRRQELSDHRSDYLPDHGPVIIQGIRDTELREGDVWVG